MELFLYGEMEFKENNLCLQGDTCSVGLNKFALQWINMKASDSKECIWKYVDSCTFLLMFET
jgi:hypothetical protein